MAARAILVAKIIPVIAPSRFFKLEEVLGQKMDRYSCNVQEFQEIPTVPDLYWYNLYVPLGFELFRLSSKFGSKKFRIENEMLLRILFSKLLPAVRGLASSPQCSYHSKNRTHCSRTMYMVASE